MFYKVRYLDIGSSTVVEHLPHHSKVAGLNPATDDKKIIFCFCDSLESAKFTRLTSGNKTFTTNNTHQINIH
jgi:hypothetical protein